MSPEQFVHYLVGNPEYDAEHYRLFKHINEFTELTEPSSAQGKAAAEKLLSMFVKHCADEEKLMYDKKYPYAEYHKESHSQMILDIEAFCKNDHSYPLIYGHYLREFSLKLASHIDNADLQFYKFIQ